MRRGRTRSWTPDEERREFARLAEGHYLEHCLERRSDEERAAYRRYAERAMDYLDASEWTGCALDLGAGEGLTTEELCRLGFDAVGLERSEKIARRAPAGRIVAGDAQAVPFRSSTFRHVQCNSLLEHVLDPRQVLSEIARLLTPDGVCLLATANRAHWTTGEIAIPFFPYLPGAVRDRLWRRSGRAHISPNYFTYNDMRSLAAEFGLVVTTPLDVRLGTYRGLRGAVGRRLHRWRIGRTLLEAALPIIMVRLARSRPGTAPR
jgi:SAM-dependent methyltransferase